MLRSVSRLLVSLSEISEPRILASSQRSFAEASLVGCRTGGDVPAGHLNSDLSMATCNIGLGRRRDLTLRQDLCLWTGEGKKTSLKEVLGGKKVLIVGYPGGPICTDKHIPNYISMSEQLRKEGVEKIVAVTVDSPEAVKAHSSKHHLEGSMVEMLADKNAGLIRLLGVDLGHVESTTEARSQRFAAIVDDGILLKLVSNGSTVSDDHSVTDPLIHNCREWRSPLESFKCLTLVQCSRYGNACSPRFERNHPAPCCNDFMDLDRIHS